MERHDVRYRPEAARDLADVYRWIFEASRDALTAQRLVMRIMERCNALGDMPLSGRRRDDLLPGLRTIAFEKRAVIAYLVVADTVQITNVFYGGRDFEALYRDET